MSIYGPAEKNPTAAPDNYVTKEYVNTRDGQRMLKAGDTMMGVLTVDSSRVLGRRDAIIVKTGQANIKMEKRGVSITTGNLAVGTTAGGPDIDILQGTTVPEGGIRIRNVSNTKHFQLGWNNSRNLELRHTGEGTEPTVICEFTPAGRISSLTDPAVAQDVATKSYVDSRKPIITVWAEENGPLSSGSYEWSFGDKSTGRDHSHCGYVMMVNGRVLRMGLAATTSNGHGATRAVVKIVKNGQVEAPYTVTKPHGQVSGTSVFSSPLELSRGDTINFFTATINSDVSSAVVTLLIELDL